MDEGSPRHHQNEVRAERNIGAICADPGTWPHNLWRMDMVDTFLVLILLILTEVSLHSQAALNIVFDLLHLPNVTCDYGEVPLCAAIVLCCNATYLVIVCVIICWHLRHGPNALQICGEGCDLRCL